MLPLKVLLKMGESDVVVPQARLVELAPLRRARRKHHCLVGAVLRIELLDHANRMEHRAVGRGQVPQQFRPIDLDVRHDGRTRLRDHRRRLVLPHVFQIGLDGQFRAEAHVEGRLHAQRLEPAVDVQIMVREIRGDGRRRTTATILTPEAASLRKRSVSSASTRAS